MTIIIIFVGFFCAVVCFHGALKFYSKKD